MELEHDERDEHGQLISIDGLTSVDLSDEIASHERRLIALDVSIDRHHARLESNAIPDADMLAERTWAANAEGSRRHHMSYLDLLRRVMGHLNRTSKEARARSHQGVFVSVARQLLDVETFNLIQDQVARELNERN